MSGTDGEQDAPEFDIFLSGMVFLDIIFTGLPTPPTPGKEIWASGMGSGPGGIANLAVAGSRLGLRTSLAAAFSDDAYGEFCWETLADEEIDLSHSQRFEHWHSPVTVSIATGGDRSMVTHGHAAPLTAAEMIGRPPRSRAVMLDLETDPESLGSTPEWVQRARDDGACVFADVGWDDTGTWAPETLDQLAGCDAFLPNAVEAMAYTRTDTARDALYALADRVPLAVVTAGVNGAMAIDSKTGEEAEVPALRVEAIDATGAGDVFATGLILGTLEGWPLENRLAFASLCSGLAVEQFGGSLAAPGLGDVLDWWAEVKQGDEHHAYAASLRRRYGFLDELHPETPVRHRRRAAATIARLSDVGTTL